MIKLPEQDVKTFKYFVHWLYTRRLRGFYYPASIKPSLQELRQAAITELEAQGLDALQYLDQYNPSGRAVYMAHYRDAPFSHLVGLYILADTLLVHVLKDPIITLIIDVYCWSVPTKLAKDISNAKGTQQKGTGADKVELSSADSGIDVYRIFTTPFWRYAPLPGLEDPFKGINMAWEALPRHSGGKTYKWAAISPWFPRCGCSKLCLAFGKTRP